MYSYLANPKGITRLPVILLPIFLLKKVTWAGPGLLAAATGEGLVRFWDLSSAKNYVLTLPSGGLDRTDKSTCISFDPIRRFERGRLRSTYYAA